MQSINLLDVISMSLCVMTYPSCRGDSFIGKTVGRKIDLDNRTCREVDVVLQQDNIRSNIECVTQCVQSTHCSCVFHKTGYCQGCSSCHNGGIFPVLPGTVYYYLSPDLSEYPGVLTFDNNYYLINEDTMDWDSARSYCNSLGGKLADLYSPEEHTWLKSHLTASSYWIGARLLTPTTYLWWRTNQPMTYELWVPGEPAGYHHCVTLWGAYGYDFDDVTCDLTMASVICKSL